MGTVLLMPPQEVFSTALQLYFLGTLFCFVKGQQHTVLTTAAFRQPITMVLLTFQCRVALKLRKYFYGVLIAPRS